MSDAWLLSVLARWPLEIPSEKHMTQEHFSFPSPCGSAPDPLLRTEPEDS